MVIQKDENPIEERREGRIIEAPLTMEEIIESDMWLFELRKRRKQLAEESEKKEAGDIAQ